MQIMTANGWRPLGGALERIKASQTELRANLTSAREVLAANVAARPPITANIETVRVHHRALMAAYDAVGKAQNKIYGEVYAAA